MFICRRRSPPLIDHPRLCAASLAVLVGLAAAVARAEGRGPALVSGPPPGAARPASSLTLVVNEVDYDQPGTDTAEFVELENVGPAPVDLDPFVLLLINGSTSAPYRTVDLPAVVLPPGERFVVCGTDTFVPGCNLPLGVSQDLLQNDTEAVAIELGGIVIDTLSYEGDVVGYTEGSGVPRTQSDNNNTARVGLSRYPDGIDTDDNSADFSLRCVSPGAPNVEPSSGCDTGSETPTPTVPTTGTPPTPSPAVDPATNTSVPAVTTQPTNTAPPAFTPLPPTPTPAPTDATVTPTDAPATATEAAATATQSAATATEAAATATVAAATATVASVTPTEATAVPSDTPVPPTPSPVPPTPTPDAGATPSTLPPTATPDASATPSQTASSSPTQEPTPQSTMAAETTPTPTSGPPLAVALVDLAAQRVGADVAVSWRTLAEVDHAGFHVWRATEASGPVRLTDRLIPGRGGELSGAAYRFVDRRAPSGAALYWVVDVDTRARTTSHGPVRVPAWRDAILPPSPVPLASPVPPPAHPPEHPPAVLPVDPGAPTMIVLPLLTSPACPANGKDAP